MDKINNDLNKMPFFPFPPEKKLQELNKKPNEEPFFPFPPEKKLQELSKKPNEEPFFPFPPEKTTDKKKVVNESLIEDKVKLSWNSNEEEGIDLNQIKDVFIKSKSVM
ncbi:MAG: hypothetical protein ACP5O4_02355 [bacterium]